MRSSRTFRRSRRTTPGSKALIFRYPFAKELRVTARQVNEWNGREGNQTRCYVSKEGLTVLTYTVSLEAGVSFKQLSSTYDALQKERADFVAFVKMQNNDARELRPGNPHAQLTSTRPAYSPTTAVGAVREIFDQCNGRRVPYLTERGLCD